MVALFLQQHGLANRVRSRDLGTSKMASIPRAALRVARVISLASRPLLAASRPLSALRVATPAHSRGGRSYGPLPATASIPLRRFFSSDQQGLTEGELKDRVLQVLKLFDKVNPEKVTDDTALLCRMITVV